MSRLRFDEQSGSFHDDATGEDVYLKVHYEIKDSNILPSEPTDYVVQFKGKIEETRVSESSMTEKSAVIGSISGVRVLAAAASEDGESLEDVCDATSDEAILCYSALFDNNGDFREDLELVDFGPDFLVIDYLTILPAYRGRDVGLLAMRNAITKFGSGCALVAIHPFPLQFRECAEKEDDEKPEELRMNYKAMSKDKSASTKKLERHYARLGFHTIPSSSEVMIYDLGFKTTPIAELLKKPRRKKAMS